MARRNAALAACPYQRPSPLAPRPALTNTPALTNAPRRLPLPTRLAPAVNPQDFARSMVAYAESAMLDEFARRIAGMAGRFGTRHEQSDARPSGWRSR